MIMWTPYTTQFDCENLTSEQKILQKLITHTISQHVIWGDSALLLLLLLLSFFIRTKQDEKRKWSYAIKVW